MTDTLANPPATDDSGQLSPPDELAAVVAELAAVRFELLGLRQDLAPIVAMFTQMLNSPPPPMLARLLPALLGGR